MTIEGTKGAVEMRADYQLAISTAKGLEVEYGGSPLRRWTSEPWHVAQDSVLHTQAHWLECFRSGREPETSGRDNLKTYALAEAAYVSAASGQAATPVAWEG